jgi:pimeloyl-ACP methyl ester carboxylesterase
MLVELVQTTTADGLRLDGALLPRQENTHSTTDSPLALDAVLCLHGAGSHFYGSSIFPGLLETFAKLGLAVLRVNTRGHDIVSTAATDRGPKRLGGAFEIVDDCRHDVAAWLDFLAARGFSRVAVVGHSLGAVKAIYALANAPHNAARGIVAISPPRLSYRFFRQSPRDAEFFASITTAQQQVAEGRGNTLMEVTFPLPYLITAAGYVDKYGSAERYNFMNILPQVPAPALFAFGELELEQNAAFFGLADAVAESPAGLAARNVTTIPGANHFYVGVTGLLAAKIEAWLRITFPKQ